MVVQPCGVHRISGMHAHCTIRAPPPDLRESVAAEPPPIVDAEFLIT
jgi:hypothetical protein